MRELVSPAAPGHGGVRVIGASMAVAGVSVLAGVAAADSARVVLSQLSRGEADLADLIGRMAFATGGALAALAGLIVLGEIRAALRPRRSRREGRQLWAARLAALLIGAGAPAVAHAAAAPVATAPAAAATIVGAPRLAPPAADLPEGTVRALAHSSPAAAGGTGAVGAEVALEVPDPRWGGDSHGTKPSLRLLTGTRAAHPDPGTVTVRQGECLWDIVARHLGPSAGAGAIDREWPRWYAENRATIGSDPDLIRPGLVLRVPARGVS